MAANVSLVDHMLFVIKSECPAPTLGFFFTLGKSLTETI